MTSRLAITLLLTMTLAACASRQRPSPIPDLPETREVLDLIESYRQAMEARDVDGLVSLASQDYLETMGTPDGADDLSFTGLRDKLTADFESVQTLRLDVNVVRVQFDDEKAIATVDYRYDLRFQLSLPAGEKWHNQVDVKRMKLRREEPGWRVIAGM